MDARHHPSFPRKRRAVRGMSRSIVAARQAPPRFSGPSGWRDSERRAWRALSKYRTGVSAQGASAAALRSHRRTAQRRQIYQGVLFLGPSGDADLGAARRVVEPTRSASGVERASGAPLPSGERGDSLLDLVGCQSTTAERDICRDFCCVERAGGGRVAASRQGDVAADRRHPPFRSPSCTNGPTGMAARAA
jgi:hypothetical protein